MMFLAMLGRLILQLKTASPPLHTVVCCISWSFCSVLLLLESVTIDNKGMSNKGMSNSYTMATRDLPDIYALARGPWAYIIDESRAAISNICDLI